MRIIVTGAGGLLGGRLASVLAERHEVTGMIRIHPAPSGVASQTMDLAEAEAIGSSLRDLRPDVVVHCAALADAEICERDPARAGRENETATRNVARACRRAGARLIAISTDLVFEGATAFADEDTPPRPIMEYGRSKLRAEAAAMAEAPGSVVLRVALIHGRGHGLRRTASESIADRLAMGETVTLYDDEWRSPVDPESVATAVEGAAQSPRAAGIYHVAGPERLTRLEFGQRVAAALGLNAGLLRRASQSSHRGAPRPRDVSLNITRARTGLRYAPRALHPGILESRDYRVISEAP